MASLLAVTCGAQAPSPAAAAGPPTAPGHAGVWFHRDYEPYESWNLARIDMNGNYVGAVENGGSAGLRQSDGVGLGAAFRRCGRNRQRHRAA